MKAVMYGAGNIGRGFIGALLSQSGYRVTFVDIAKSVVEQLQNEEEYPIRYVSGEGTEDVWIRNVTAVDGNHVQSVADAIAECDIMATAVGARVLPFIVPNIVSGLRKRWSIGGKPLNIIVCENLNDANLVLEGLIKEKLTSQECLQFDRSVGLVEASIGRMVPVQTEEMKDGNPLRVCVERYGFLPVDKAAFKSDIPNVKSMIPYEPFDFYMKRKLYVHNMGHAVCAYLGDLAGHPYIWQAIDDAQIRIVVENAMMESALALSDHFGVPLNSMIFHMKDLLHRFANAALKDTCMRVGGDPGRKLSPEDRLIGAAKMCIQEGGIPVYISLGIAAGVYRYIRENDKLEQGIQTAQTVLEQVSGLEKGTELMKQILSLYIRILKGESLYQLRLAADTMKASTLGSVV